MEWKSILTAVCCLTAATSPVMADQMTVAAWGGSFTEGQRKAIFDPFTAATGVRVLDAVYTGGLGQLRAMAESGNAAWDVVQLEGPDLLLACQEGLVAPIDAARLKNANALGKSVSECGVGASGWSIVLGYNKSRLPRAPQGWADFWDVEHFPGKRALRRSAQYALEAALLADGVDKDRVYEVLSTPAGVDRAFAKLERIKPHIQWWEAGAQPAEWLASGNVVMSSSYVGRLVSAAGEGAPVGYVWQGSFYSVDSWAVVANGKARDEDVYAFLDFASLPERQAAFSMLYPVAPTNPAADELVPAERRAIMPVADNLAQGMRTRDAFWIDHAEALNERFNAWLNN